jgi:hypothetical protein
MSLRCAESGECRFCESPFVVLMMRNPLYRYLAEEDT